MNHRIRMSGTDIEPLTMGIQILLILISTHSYGMNILCLSNRLLLHQAGGKFSKCMKVDTKDKDKQTYYPTMLSLLFLCFSDVLVQEDTLNEWNQMRSLLSNLIVSQLWNEKHDVNNFVEVNWTVCQENNAHAHFGHHVFSFFITKVKPPIPLFNQMVSLSHDYLIVIA